MPFSQDPQADMHSPSPSTDTRRVDALSFSDHRYPRLSAVAGLMVWICGLISINSELHAQALLEDPETLLLLLVGGVSFVTWCLLKVFRRHWTIERPLHVRCRRGFRRVSEAIPLPETCTLARDGRSLYILDARGPQGATADLGPVSESGQAKRFRETVEAFKAQAPVRLNFATQRAAIICENRLLAFLDPERRAPMIETPDLLGRARSAPVTYFIIVVNIIISVTAWLKGGDFLMSGALTNAGVQSGETYRLLTSLFLHYNGLHLMMNMLALSSLGQQVERIVGPKRLLIIYMAAGLGGGLWALQWIGPVALVGASGAVFGLFGSIAYFIYLGRRHLAPTVMLPTSRQLTVDLLINAMISTLPMVSFAAHFGGFVSGFVMSAILMWLWPLRPLSRQRREGFPAA